MSEQFKTLRATDVDFISGIQSVVDYRGDVTITLKNGAQFAGYVYNASRSSLDMFPRDSSRKETIQFSDISEIAFTGADTAKGKSWEDWMKRKAATAAEQVASSPA